MPWQEKRSSLRRNGRPPANRQPNLLPTSASSSDQACRWAMKGSEITAAAEGFVRISGLGKVFRREQGSVQVLRNVSLTVPNRQFISILGASGCGKTTLLLMLAGLESITSGTIEIARQPV